MKQIFVVLAFVLTCSTMFAKHPQRPNSYNYQRGVEAVNKYQYISIFICKEEFLSFPLFLL